MDGTKQPTGNDDSSSQRPSEVPAAVAGYKRPVSREDNSTPPAKISSGEHSDKSVNAILQEFRDDILSNVNAKTCAPELRRQGVIAASTETDIEQAKDARSACGILYDHLCQNCSFNQIVMLPTVLMGVDEGFGRTKEVGQRLHMRIHGIDPGGSDQQLSPHPLPMNTTNTATVGPKRPATSEGTTSPLANISSGGHTGVKASVPPDVEGNDFSYLLKEMKKAAKNKKADAHDLIKTLYLHTYVYLEVILKRNEQQLDMMVTAAQTAFANGLAEGDAKALTDTHTVKDLLQKLNIMTKWDDTYLLERIVGCLPEEAKALAMNSVDRYEVYLDVYHEADLLKESKEAEPEANTQTQVEVTMDMDFDQYTRKDCEKMLNGLLCNACKIPRHKIKVAAARSGNSTTVVVIIDRAFLQNIVKYIFEASTLWAFQEFKVTRIRIPGEFEFTTSQLPTEIFKEALHCGLASGMDFIGVTKVLPYQVHALVDLDRADLSTLPIARRTPMRMCMGPLAVQVSKLEEKQKGLGPIHMTVDLSVIAEQIAKQVRIRKMVWWLGLELEAFGRERHNVDATLQDMAGESVNNATVMHRFSELEHKVSTRFSKLQQLRELAKRLKELSDHIDTWRRNKERELDSLELQYDDLSKLNKAKALIRDLQNFPFIRKMDEVIDALQDFASERSTDGAVFRKQSFVLEAGRKKMRYDDLKRRGLQLMNDTQDVLRDRAFTNVRVNIDQLVDTAREMRSERRSGSAQMIRSAEELDRVFTMLMVILVGAVATTVVTGAVATILTAGAAAPVAAAALAGGVAAGAAYIAKRIKENAALERTNNWIHKDRPRCEHLWKLIDEYDKHWQELVAQFPNVRDVDRHLREKGINGRELRECCDEISKLTSKWHTFGFGSQRTEDIERAEHEVRTFLKSEHYDPNYISAVTLFLDLVKIGAIGYDVAYIEHTKPPMRKLLRIIAEGLERDAAPAERMAEKGWLIQTG